MELGSRNNTKFKSVNEWISEVDSKLNNILDDFLTKSQVATQLNTIQKNKSDTNKTSDLVKSKKHKKKLSESLTTSAILQRDQGLHFTDRHGRKGEDNPPGTGKNASTYATFHDGETLVDIVDSDVEITSKKKRKIEKGLPNGSSVSSKKKKKRNNVKEGSVTSVDSLFDHKEDGDLFFFDMSGSIKNGNSMPIKENHAPIENKNTIIDMVDSELELTYSDRKTKKNKTRNGYESNRDPLRKKKKKFKKHQQSTKIDEDSKNNNTLIDMVESEIELTVTYSDRSNENKTQNGYERTLDPLMKKKKKSKENDQSTKIDEGNHYCSTSSEITDSFQLGQQVSPRKNNKSKWEEKTEYIDLSQKTPKKKKKKDKSEKYIEESNSNSFVIPEMGTTEGTTKKKKVKNKDNIDNSNLVEELSQETQIEEKSKKKKNKEEKDPVQYIKELFEEHSLDHSKLFGETVEKTEIEESMPNHNLPGSNEKPKKKNRDLKPQVEENTIFQSTSPKKKSKKKKNKDEKDPVQYIKEHSLDHSKLFGETVEKTETEESMPNHNLPGSNEKSKKKNRDLKPQVEENAIFKSPSPKEKSKKKKIKGEDPLNYIEEHSLDHSKLLGESIELTELEENVPDHNLPGSKSKKKNRDLKSQVEENTIFKSPNPKEKSKKKKVKGEDPLNCIEEHSLDHSKLLGESIELTEFEENVPDHNLPGSKSKKKNRHLKPQVEENTIFESPSPKEKSKKKKINGEDPLNYIEEHSLDHLKLLEESVELTKLEQNVADHNLPGSKSKKRKRDLKPQVEENIIFESPSPKEKSKKKKINGEDPLNYIEEHSLDHSKLLGESIELTELEENVPDHNLPGSKSKKKNRDLKPQVEENTIFKSPNPKEKSKKKKVKGEDPLNYIEEHSLDHLKLLEESVELTKLEQNVPDHNLPGSKSKKKNRDLKPQAEENTIFESPSPKEKSKKKKINGEDPLNYIEEHSRDHLKLLGESVELTKLEENVHDHNLPGSKSKKKNRDLKPQVEENAIFKSPSPKEKSKKKKIKGEDPLNYIEEHSFNHSKLLGESIELTELEGNVPDHNLPGSNEKSKKKNKDIKQDEDSLEYIKELFREHQERSSTNQNYFEIWSGVKKKKKKKKSKERISEDLDSQIPNESLHINDNIEGENFQIENVKSQISYQTFEEYLNFDELVYGNLNVNGSQNSATKLKNKSKLSPDSKLEKLNNLSASNSKHVTKTEYTQVVEENAEGVLITPDLFDDDINIREGQILENVEDSILDEFVKKNKKSKNKEDNVGSTSFEESPDKDLTNHRKRKTEFNTSESSETADISKPKKSKKSSEANGKRKLTFDYLTLHNNTSVLPSVDNGTGIDNEHKAVKSEKTDVTSTEPEKVKVKVKNNDSSIDNEHTGKAKSKEDDTSDTSIDNKPVEKVKSKKNNRKSKEKENSPSSLKKLLNKNMKKKENISVEDLPEAHKKNKTLNIKLPSGYKVPPLHRIKMASKCTEEEMKLAKSSNAKFGAFGQQEDAVIIKNWKSFCQIHELPEDPTMFLKLSNIDKEERKTFLQFLSQGLEKRLPLRVYRRFKKIYEKAQKKQGRYTKLEDEKLIEFMATTASKKPHHDCGILLNRSAASIETRYNHLISPENEILVKWDGEMSEKLIRAMLQVAETDNVKVLQSMDFTRSQWNAVSNLLGGIPVKKIVRAWKITIYPRLFSREDREYIKRTLIAKLVENGENDFRTIVWKNYAKLFRGVTPRMMGDTFRIMMKHVPNQYKSNLKAILGYMNSHYQDAHFKCRTPTRQIKYKFKNGRLTQTTIKAERL